MDDVYKLIEKNDTLKGNFKLIGIGAGNSDMEVNIFKKSFKVPFPLFSDEDFSMHKKLGQVKTPYFIAVQINDDGSTRVFYSELGGFKNAEEFLQSIIKLSGVK